VKEMKLLTGEGTSKSAARDCLFVLVRHGAS
jgi:hypothetical protein